MSDVAAFGGHAPALPAERTKSLSYVSLPIKDLFLTWEGVAAKQNPIGSDVLDRHGCVLRMNLGQSDWVLVECCQRSVFSCVH